jgi:hypothetical protein
MPIRKRQMRNAKTPAPGEKGIRWWDELQDAYECAAQHCRLVAAEMRGRENVAAKMAWLELARRIDRNAKRFKMPRR